VKRGRWSGAVLAATLISLALTPAHAAAATKPSPAQDRASGRSTVSSPVFQAGRTTTRQRLPFVHRNGADFAAAGRTQAVAGAASSLQLPVGGGVGTSVQVSPSVSDPFSETAVAADPNVASGQHLSASSNLPSLARQPAHPSFSSTDGGTNWTTASVPNIFVPNLSFFSDPGVAYNTNPTGINQVLFSTLAVDSSGHTEVDLSSMNADGSASASNVIVQSSFEEPDKPFVAVDQSVASGTAYVGYNTNPELVAGNPLRGMPLVVTHAASPYSTWTPAQVWNSGGDIGAFPAVGGDGTVYVAWDDFCGGTPVNLNSCPKPNGQILLLKSTDHGVSFPVPSSTNLPIHVTDTTTGFGSILPNYATGCVAGCPPRPVGPSVQMAVNGSDLFLVWGDGSDRPDPASTVPSQHRMHVFLQESKDGGATWLAKPLQVDSNNANDAWEPSIAVDKGNGKVVIAWFDRRDDPNNKLYRTYYTSYVPGASAGVNGSFTAQLPVSDMQSDPTVDCNGTGDYMQIAAAGGSAHPVWTDTRNGRPQVFTAAIDEATAAAAPSVLPNGAAGTLASPNGSSWAALPGSAQDIGVGANCQAWVIGTNAVPGGGGVFFLDGQRNWVGFSGGGVRITVQAEGFPRLINNANGIFRLQRQPDHSLAWQQLPGAGTDIGSDGALWLIGTNPVPGGFGIYFLDSTSNWVGVDGGAVRIAVGPDGLPWIVNSAGSIFHRVNNNTAWLALPGGAQDIGVGADGTPWVIGTNAVPGGFGIYRWDGSTWVGIDGGGVQISVGGDGLPWIVNSTGSVFERV
jgi:hypothetical protein